MTWKVKNLGQLCSLVNGKAFRAADWSESGLPIIRIQNLNDPTKPFNHWDRGLDRQVHVQKKDLLIAWSGTPGTSFGAHIWNGPEGVLNQHIFRVDIANADVTKEWLKFCVNIQLLQLIDKAHGGVGLKHVTKGAVEAVQIPLPPPAEQKRLAGILNAADALRAKRRESLDQLDTFLQSTFLDMFGDPVTNPKGWDAPTLGEVVKVKSGDGLTAKNMAPDGEFPVYGGNGINGYHDSYMFEEPKIILGRVGVYCGVVHHTKPNAWVTDNALYVREFLRPVDTTYMIEALKVANLNQYANQAAQPLISGSRIYPVTILMPPLELQRRFATIVESVEQQRATQRAHLDELDTLFASMQSRAFRGDL